MGLSISSGKKDDKKKRKRLCVCVCVGVTGGMPVKMPQESSRVSKESDWGRVLGSGNGEELLDCELSQRLICLTLPDNCTYGALSVRHGVQNLLKGLGYHLKIKGLEKNMSLFWPWFVWPTSPQKWSSSSISSISGVLDCSSVLCGQRWLQGVLL